MRRRKNLSYSQLLQMENLMKTLERELSEEDRGLESRMMRVMSETGITGPFLLKLVEESQSDDIV
jgi:hypothetical protein